MSFSEYRDQFGYVDTKDELICNMTSLGFNQAEINQTWELMEEEWMSYCEDEDLEIGEND